MEFLQKMRERGHKISVLLGKWEGRTRENFAESNIDFYFASTMDVLSSITGTPYPVLRNVSRYVRMVNPDVVHANSHLFLSSHRAVEASHIMGIPSVVTVHGVMVKRGLVLDVLQRIYVRTVARLLFEKVSAVICLTRTDAESVARIVGGDGKIFVVPNGVDTELFKPVSVKDSNLIIWVGRFVPEKGLVYFLRAMRTVVEEHHDVRLVLVGDGPLRTELVKWVNKLGLTGKVDFVGSVGRVEVAELLSKSSIFVFPSLREGLPLSVLEAMACGVPVVGSDIPGVNDVVTHGENGFLVLPKDSKGLAESVLALLDDDELRRRFGEEARKVMVDDYGWDDVLGKIEKIYDDTT